MAADPYRLTDQTPEPDRPETSPTGRTRLILWVVLVVSAGLNAALSTVNVWAGSAVGLIVLATAVALVVDYRRGKR
ncbi:Flp pilus assembly protein TadB [Catenuloplanes nepalensis]|uniref:Flp pilus assembly protein TadB n=1 Tax=Catenuloplanes nepalensis TaxID=587533 RepID=A0ABT9MQ33_9ACTN|nr:hypothetical protein [Catenuloplanes nepalensis]MDP9793539.1 Flp pilus assembly protein TadB [Catenuloplanes nepalensis]